MIGVAILPLPLSFLSNAVVAAVVFQHVLPYLWHTTPAGFRVGMRAAP